MVLPKSYVQFNNREETHEFKLTMKTCTACKMHTQLITAYCISQGHNSATHACKIYKHDSYV
jgi:hypothetical protein